METNTQQERAKRLEQQAREYLMQSNDPIFTRYLQQLLPRIQRQPEYVEQLQAELDKSVEFWYQRQQINANRSGVICAAAECTTGGSRRRTADSRAITDTASGAVYYATGAGTGDAGSGTEEAECGISGRNHCIVGGWRNLYSDRTGIAWYVFYERLDQRYFFICSFPGSGIDRRITDPQKASETGPDLFGYRHSGVISVDHDQYDFPT